MFHEIWQQGSNWRKRLQRIVDLIDTPRQYGSEGDILALDSTGRKLRWYGADAYMLRLNRIILMHSSGWTTYDLDNAGLVDAFSAAVSGDAVWVPRHTFTIDFTVPAGVLCRGFGATLEGATPTLSNGATLEGWVIEYDVLTSSNIQGIYADLEVDEVAHVRNCYIRMVNAGAGQSDGILVEGEGLLEVHDLEIEVWGTHSAALHCNTTLSSGGAALSAEDYPGGNSVAEGACINDAQSSATATVELHIEPDAQDTDYSYFRVTATGNLFVETDWGEPPSTPVSLELQMSAVSGWGVDLEYWREETQTWVSTQFTLITTALVNVDGLTFETHVIGRIRHTPAKPSGYAKLIGLAKVNRSLTTYSTEIELCWDRLNVGIYAEDSELWGEADDIYAESGAVKDADCKYNPRKIVGTVIPVRGDRAVWDVVNYPERHARDIVSGRTVHLPEPVAENDLAIVDGDSHWSILTGPTAASQALVSGAASPYTPTWTAILDAAAILAGYLAIDGSNADQDIDIDEYEFSADILHATSTTTGQSTIAAGLIVNNDSGNGAINDFQVNSDTLVAILVDASGDTLAIGVITSFAKDVEFSDDVEFKDTVTDGSGSVGTSGQVLSSTGTKTAWVDTPAHTPTVVTKTAAYTVTTSDDVILVDATSGAITITLLAAASAQSKLYIKKIDSSSNTVTIDGNGAETIDGATTQTIVSQYDSLTLVSNGISWYII